MQDKIAVLVPISEVDLAKEVPYLPGSSAVVAFVVMEEEEEYVRCDTDAHISVLDMLKHLFINKEVLNQDNE